MGLIKYYNDLTNNLHTPDRGDPLKSYANGCLSLVHISAAALMGFVTHMYNYSVENISRLYFTLLHSRSVEWYLSALETDKSNFPDISGMNSPQFNILSSDSCYNSGNIPLARVLVDLADTDTFTSGGEMATHARNTLETCAHLMLHTQILPSDPLYPIIVGGLVLASAIGYQLFSTVNTYMRSKETE